MYDKEVNQLAAAMEVSDSDIFVMEQGGIAKKVAVSLLKRVFGSNGNGTASGGAAVDPTLSISGAAADAKVVGDAFAQAETMLEQLYEAVNRPKIRIVDVSSWSEGSIRVQDTNGEVYAWDIDFDAADRPETFTNTDNNHEVTVVWEGSGDGA